MRKNKKLMAVSVIALILIMTSCNKDKKVELPTKYIGSGELVKIPEEKLSMNLDNTAFATRIKTTPVKSTYKYIEVGKDIEQGDIYLKRLIEKPVVKVNKPAGNITKVYKHDTILKVENGDLIEVDGFKIEKLKFKPSNPNNIKAGVYRVGEGNVKAGSYKVEGNIKGVLIYPIIPDVPTDSFDMENSNELITLGKNDVVIVEKGTNLVLENQTRYQNNSIETESDKKTVEQKTDGEEQIEDDSFNVETPQ